VLCLAVRVCGNDNNVDSWDNEWVIVMSCIKGILISNDDIRIVYLFTVIIINIIV